MAEGTGNTPRGRSNALEQAGHPTDVPSTWVWEGVVMRLAHTTDPWREEPHRSRWTPEQLSALLVEHCMQTSTDRNLSEIAQAWEPDLQVERFHPFFGIS